MALSRVLSLKGMAAVRIFLLVSVCIAAALSKADASKGHRGALRDKVIIVTGASQGGLGHATAIELARNGAHLILSGRDHLRLDAVYEEVRPHGGKVTPIRGNIADPSIRSALVDEAQALVSSLGGKHFGSVGLVNSAAISYAVLDDAKRAEMQAVNLDAAIALKGLVAERLPVRPMTQAKPQAVFVDISSIFTLETLAIPGREKYPHYIELKEKLERSAAEDAERFAQGNAETPNIAVHALRPDAMWTPMIQSQTDRSSFDAWAKDALKLGHAHGPADVAPYVVDLLARGFDGESGVLGQVHNRHELDEIYSEVPLSRVLR